MMADVCFEEWNLDACALLSTLQIQVFPLLRKAIKMILAHFHVHSSKRTDCFIGSHPFRNIKMQSKDGQYTKS